MQSRHVGLLFFSLILPLSLGRPSASAGEGEAVEVTWSDYRGVANEPLGVGDADWKVVCFLGCECPLARLYAPRLARMQRDFAGRGVQLVGINSNTQDSPLDIQRYIARHELPFPIVKDGRQSLARQFGATRTPEVFLLDAANRIRYRGRIDDQYEPGSSRREPTRHELRDALLAVLDGRPVPVARTQPVGCLITFARERPTAGGASPKVTFTRDVAPILNRHCVECHRPGEIGPFSLTDYHEVTGWGEMLLEVIEQKRMPPWHADPRYGDFVGARQLPQQARKTLEAWVEQGMPEGDPAELPPPPTWAGGWHLSTPPDEQFAMRDRPFEVPAEGTVEYQYFVVDPGWDEDRWVRAAQVVPGNAAVVHHAIVFVRPPDGSEFRGIGWIGGYVPGQRTRRLPAGHARRIPAGSKLVFQMHYTPNGRSTPDTTKLGVWLTHAKEVTHEVTTRVAINQHFEIPPNTGDHAVTLDLDGFSRDSRLLSVMPHMHLRGKSFLLQASDGGQRDTLLSVPHYDFNWQHWYQFQTPVDLNRVEKLEMQMRFDNSRGNPANPAPAEYVTWGDQTWQEMAVAFFDIAHPRGKPRVAARPKQKERLDAAERERRIREAADKFLADLDRNGDGVVEEAETPDAFRRFGFRRMDSNHDGRLDRGEVESAAAERLGS